MAKARPVRHLIASLPGLIIGRILVWLAMRTSEWRELEGIPVGVVVPKGMDAEACYQRIGRALHLIAEVVPYRAARIRLDVNGILCFGTGRHGALGAYDPIFYMCLIDPRHVLDSGTTLAALARTILHEATHGRLHRRRVRGAVVGSDRVESICERVEHDFDSKYAAAKFEG